MSGPRRRRVLLGAGLVLLLAHTAFAAARHLLTGTVRIADDNHWTSVSALRWPQRGQAALVLGNGRPAASPHEQPAPIASLAKVMTAYLTLKRYPLSGAQDGFTITVTAAQVAGRGPGRRPAPVGRGGAGRRGADRAPAARGAADPVRQQHRPDARRRGGGQRGALRHRHERRGRALGMDDTIYTDPSGFEPSTVSTAADQLRLFERAMRFRSSARSSRWQP